MTKPFISLALATSWILLAYIQGPSAYASQIQYSWSGRLVPTDSVDPWQIGGGQEFVLNIAVSRDVPDLLDLNVEFAAHEVNNARLLLDGEEVSFVGNGTVGFTDDWSGRIDIIDFHGDFERFGQTIEIVSNLALPLDTFHFSQFIESPPFLGQTANAHRSTFGGQGPYAGVVAAGTPVMGVPEPFSVVLLMACGGCLIIARLGIRSVRFHGLEHVFRSKDIGPRI